MKALTVGELKKMIEGLEDDVVVVSPSSNFELSGATVEAMAMVTTMSEQQRTFTDAFDYGRYNKTVYNHDEAGKKVLYISGR